MKKIGLDVGSTTIKITLMQEIKDGEIVENGLKYEKDKEYTPEEKKKIEKTAIYCTRHMKDICQK